MGDHLVTVHLVRHGQTGWNVQRRLQGQTPHVGLSAVGRRQAADVARLLSGWGAGAVISSDLLRAVETAGVIGTALGRPIRTDSALRELAGGVLEGRPTAEWYAQVDWSTSDWAPAGGESARQLYDRVKAFLLPLLADPPTTSTVLVTHGDTIRAALAVLQGVGPQAMGRLVPPNGSVTTVRLDPVRGGCDVSRVVAA